MQFLQMDFIQVLNLMVLYIVMYTHLVYLN